jgi:hypothetical protein
VLSGEFKERRGECLPPCHAQHHQLEAQRAGPVLLAVLMIQAECRDAADAVIDLLLRCEGVWRGAALRSPPCGAVFPEKGMVPSSPPVVMGYIASTPPSPMGHKKLQTPWPHGVLLAARCVTMS